MSTRVDAVPTSVDASASTMVGQRGFTSLAVAPQCSARIPCSTSNACEKEVSADIMNKSRRYLSFAILVLFQKYGHEYHSLSGELKQPYGRQAALKYSPVHVLGDSFRARAERLH